MKKGSILDIIIWIIIGFTTLLFLAVWLYGHGQLTEQLMDTGMVAGVNASKAAQDTFGKVNSSMSILHTIAFVIIVTLAISIFISNFLVKAHPVFFIVYLLITVVAIVFSAYISNAYEALLSNELIGTTLTGFKAGTYIMLHLPIWTTVIGLFGALFLFIGITRDSGSGGSVI